MLRNLQTDNPPSPRVETDIAVVGGGIAGLVLATRLARLGLRTLVFESGSEACIDAEHPLDAVEVVGEAYRGATEGRFRGLGGTSSRWGGAMLPFLPCDLGPHTADWPVDWPVSIDAVAPYFGEIEQLFKLPKGSYEADTALKTHLAQSFQLRSAKWPAFSRRNVARLFREAIRNGPSLEIWLNATVDRFELGPNGRLETISATSLSGQRINVAADFFVIAAGAIESTRLLLVLDAQHDERVFRPQGRLGRGLHDHLSTAAATVAPKRLSALNAAFGMRFVASGMRDTRIEPSYALRWNARLPGAFAHVAATGGTGSGFDALRALYHARQIGQPVGPRHVAAALSDLPWLARAAWWRFAKGRLLYPRDTDLVLMLVMEQCPRSENTITLSPTKKDVLGMPLARIAWGPSDQDAAAFGQLQSALHQWWRDSGLVTLADFHPIPEECWRAGLIRGSDIYHPGGTVAMSRKPTTGVTNGEQQTFGIENLYVASTATFPSGGTSNPTFMLMAFALRLADTLSDRCSKINPH